MSEFKKLASILLALIMILALGATAFADNEPVSGETYTAYKIFDRTSNGNAYSYTISADSEWLSVVQSYSGVKLTKSADDSKYVVDSLDDAKAFAEHLAKNTSGKTAADTKTASDTVVTFDSLAEGYYLVTSSLGSIVASTDGSGNLSLKEKNAKPTVDKKYVDNTDAYAQIGDTINYTVTVNTGNGANQAITLTDTMSNSLTLNKESFSVTVDGEAVDAANYTLSYPSEGESYAFKIVFSEDYVKSLGSDKNIVVTYSATLNENAVSVDAENKAHIDYSNQTDEKTVTTKTNSFSVLKYVDGDENKAPLAGATFQLKQGDTVIKLIKVSDTEYRVANGEEAGAVDSFTTVDSGNITIKGVDSDKNYTLVETVAPAGYKLLTAPVTVDVAEDNTTVSEIPNTAGTSLPTTGGMGTTLLYAVGMILVIGAGVVLVTRRRMNASK